MAENGMEDLEWLSDYLVSALKSPTWVLPIAEFVDTRSFMFDDAEENKLEYTICHNDFKRLVDDLFTAHLLEVSVTPEGFEQFCSKGLSSRQSLHHILVEQLLSVEDFLVFKAMMVKRNADLDRRAALEGFAVQEGQAPAPIPAVAAEAVSLTHSSGRASFCTWPMTEDVLAWHDRDFTYFGIPEELKEAILFAGPHKEMPTGMLTFTCCQDVTLYLMYENSGHRRDGGFAARLKFFPEWAQVGGTKMKWGTVRGKDCWVAVWSRKVSAGASISINMQEPFVGGFAVKADSGEWRLYEEQEQLMKALTATGLEAGASDEQICHAAALTQEADARLEEAQLEQAIALSLQAEEERLRQIEQFGAEATPAPAPEVVRLAAAAELPAPEMCIAPPAAPAPVPPPAASSSPVPSSEAVEASRYEEPIPDLPPLHAPKELNPVMPRMMRLNPIVNAPVAVPPVHPAVVDQLRADSILRRERAEGAISAPSATATATPAVAQEPVAHYAPQQPSDEEKRLRAEHLKRQRALLMDKRTAEREQQLQAYHASRGSSAASLDRFAAASSPAMGDSAAAFRVAETAPIRPDEAQAAQAMRQALTLQLRQTLTSNMPSESLGQNVEQLESIKRR